MAIGAPNNRGLHCSVVSLVLICGLAICFKSQDFLKNSVVYDKHGVLFQVAVLIKLATPSTLSFVSTLPSVLIFILQTLQ